MTPGHLPRTANHRTGIERRILSPVQTQGATTETRASRNCHDTCSVQHPNGTSPRRLV